MDVRRLLYRGGLVCVAVLAGSATGAEATTLTESQKVEFDLANALTGTTTAAHGSRAVAGGSSFIRYLHFDTATGWAQVASDTGYRYDLSIDDRQVAPCYYLGVVLDDWPEGATNPTDGPILYDLPEDAQAIVIRGDWLVIGRPTAGTGGVVEVY